MEFGLTDSSILDHSLDLLLPSLSKETSINKGPYTTANSKVQLLNKSPMLGGVKQSIAASMVTVSKLNEKSELQLHQLSNAQFLMQAGQ